MARFCIALILVFATITESPAQQQGAARYDLRQCVDYALQHSDRTTVSREEVEVALALHKQALSSLWPQVSGRVVASRMDENPNFVFPASVIPVPASTFTVPPTAFTLPANSFGPGFPPVDIPLMTPPTTVNIPAQSIQVPRQDVTLMNRDSVVGSLNVTYPIYTGGLRRARIRQAKYGVEVAKEEERHTAAEIAYDVTRLYYAEVLSRQLTRIASDTVARMEATLNLTEKMYQTGTGTVKKTDYLRNKAVVETLKTILAEMESKLQVVRLTLSTAMGLQLDDKYELADAELPFAKRELDQKALVEKAYASNPDLAKLRAALKATEAGIAAATSGHLPKLAFFGSAQRIGNSYSSGIVTPENKSNWSVGLGLEIPIFEGFRVNAEEREARSRLRVLQSQATLLQQKVALDVASTCKEVLKTEQQRESSLQAFTSATENRELNVRAYQEELVETKEVIEAQLLEALFSSQHQKVLYDHLESLARLDFVVGTPNHP
jgi:outer membrane protein